MKHYFLDTNVIIDFLADRTPFAEAASQLFYLQTEKKIKIYCSAISFNNIYYLFRQSYRHPKSIQLLKDLLGMTDIISFGDVILSSALESSFRDFEDAIQYYSATSLSRVDGLVTRNRKDFPKNGLAVLSPLEAVSLASSTT